MAPSNPFLEEEEGGVKNSSRLADLATELLTVATSRRSLRESPISPDDRPLQPPPKHIMASALLPAPIVPSDFFGRRPPRVRQPLSDPGIRCEAEHSRPRLSRHQPNFRPSILGASVSLGRQLPTGPCSLGGSPPLCISTCWVIWGLCWATEPPPTNLRAALSVLRFVQHQQCPGPSGHLLHLQDRLQDWGGCGGDFQLLRGGYAVPAGEGSRGLPEGCVDGGERHLW